MAREAEQAAIVVGDPRHARRRQLVALAAKTGAGAMLEPAIAVADRGNLKEVAVEGRTAPWRATEQVDVPLANAPQVGREPVQVGVDLAGDRDVVRRAARLEGRHVEIGHFHRMVDQLVVVGRAVGAERPRRGTRARQCGRNAPVAKGGALRRDDLHLARRIGTTFRAEENRRAVEIATEAVEVRRANGEIERVDVRHYGQRSGAGRCAPKILGFLGDRHRADLFASARTLTKCRANSRIR